VKLHSNERRGPSLAILLSMTETTHGECATFEKGKTWDTRGESQEEEEKKRNFSGQ